VLTSPPIPLSLFKERGSSCPSVLHFVPRLSVEGRPQGRRKGIHPEGDKRGRGKRQEFEAPALVYLPNLLVTDAPSITNYLWITDEVSVTNQKVLWSNEKTVEAPDGFSHCFLNIKTFWQQLPLFIDLIMITFADPHMSLLELPGARA
jgi:hypothetical protein